MNTFWERLQLLSSGLGIGLVQPHTSGSFSVDFRTYGHHGSGWDGTKKQEKPFHIKRENLCLDGYGKGLLDGSPAHLFKRAVTSLLISRQFHLYLLIQALTAAIGYGQRALWIGILWMCYVNTGEGIEGEKSAYSSFNENAKALSAMFDLKSPALLGISPRVNYIPSSLIPGPVVAAFYDRWSR
ncbi:unnamed protein product [Tuber aestivum]|uniref:SAYSvFN domain-containing protein n=1 Tax=Tuber aestivum TaxID=59557 RepID=A0A292PQN0_9PEZI|nr:unnamed protein product [Tuber aestivum]